VPAEIVRGELYVANVEFFRGWVQRGLERGETVVLEDVEQRGLAGVVEALFGRGGLTGTH
jgi:hypothetical protein